MSSDIKKIGVIGAGQMGNGIAHVCALADHDVYLMDVSDEGLEKGLESIRKNLDRAVARGKMSQADMDACMGRISSGTNYDGFSDCDLVIEAATENEELKKEIIRDLDRKSVV